MRKPGQPDKRSKYKISRDRLKRELRLIVRAEGLNPSCRISRRSVNRLGPNGQKAYWRFVVAENMLQASKNGNG
ncbi:MAG: hypothetical protein A2301_01360 [Candidatus Magasanikbacteria bacterium RIFOXYB2_FULL_40_13]|nr:MAG: hypothetical protein A2301_01360 [Candidatus Magasanikbacteria bacterium RIFOXYB2_FULL_40_13]